MITVIIICLLTILSTSVYMIYSVYKMKQLMKRKIPNEMREYVVNSLPPLTKWIYQKIK